MKHHLRDIARATPGFMPEDEGLALRDAAMEAPEGDWVEVGSYCGKSAIFLGDAALVRGALLYSIDHHRGSEEHQAGEEWHDPHLVDPDGRVNTLPPFITTIVAARLQNIVIATVGRSRAIATDWRSPVSLVFIDGGHSEAAAVDDYEGWVPHLVPGGLLAIHDVFPDPRDGGRPPFLIYRRALDSKTFRETSSCGSLRVLERVSDGSA